MKECYYVSAVRLDPLRYTLMCCSTKYLPCQKTVNFQRTVHHGSVSKAWSSLIRLVLIKPSQVRLSLEWKSLSLKCHSLDAPVVQRRDFVEMHDVARVGSECGARLIPPDLAIMCRTKMAVKLLRALRSRREEPKKDI